MYNQIKNWIPKYINGYFQKSVKTTQITKVTVFFEKGMEGKYLSSHLLKESSL